MEEKPKNRLFKMSEDPEDPLTILTIAIIVRRIVQSGVLTIDYRKEFGVYLVQDSEGRKYILPDMVIQAANTPIIKVLENGEDGKASAISNIIYNNPWTFDSTEDIGTPSIARMINAELIQQSYESILSIYRGIPDLALEMARGYTVETS